MELLDETIERELPDLAKQGVRTRFFGRRDRVPAELQAKMATLEAETAHLDRLQLWIAFDYGGRAELVEATRSDSSAEGVRPQDVSEDGHRRAPLRARAPRSRPRDPHVGRAADLELPALAVGVRGARLRRHALARLRRGAAPMRRSRSTRAARAGSARDEPVGLARPRRGRSCCRWSSASSTWAAGGSSASRSSEALLALHELYVMARELRPLVLGGYLGFVADAARTAARRARVDARRAARDVRLRVRRLRARRRQAVRDDVVRRHAARRRVGRGAGSAASC